MSPGISNETFILHNLSVVALRKYFLENVCLFGDTLLHLSICISTLEKFLQRIGPLGQNVMIIQNFGSELEVESIFT